MIDRAAVDMDKYPIMISNNDMDSLFPGRAGTNYNPWETSTGDIDLNTENGRAAFLAAGEKNTIEHIIQIINNLMIYIVKLYMRHYQELIIHKEEINMQTD